MIRKAISNWTAEVLEKLAGKSVDTGLADPL
jgi:hypothetical protein